MHNKPRLIAGLLSQIRENSVFLRLRFGRLDAYNLRILHVEGLFDESQSQRQADVREL